MKEVDITEFAESMTKFASGATRSADMGKLDYEGFYHPAVMRRYAQYLNKHRVQADGKVRDSDNWSRGMPIWRYVKSLCRHTLDTWLHHRGQGHLAEYEDMEDCICAGLFNYQGLLLEKLIERGEVKRTPAEDEDCKALVAAAPNGEFIRLCEKCCGSVK